MDEAAVPYENLPATLPIFPLSGVLLLPRGVLPLHIFEPRYRAMIRDAMAADRLIGMVQPSEPEAPEPPPVFGVGCAGKITSCSETPDGRYFLNLSGVCRFSIKAELPLLSGYRRVVPDWAPWRTDLAIRGDGGVDRARLEAGLQIYFRQQELAADWDAIRQTSDERLITSLAMICPFAPSEKQALLEASSLAERARIMIALVEMAAVEGAEKPGAGALH